MSAPEPRAVSFEGHRVRPSRRLPAVFTAIALLAGAYSLAGPTSATGENILAFAIFLGALVVALTTVVDRRGSHATPTVVSASRAGLELDSSLVATPEKILRVQIVDDPAEVGAVDQVEFELESGRLELAVPRDQVEPLLAALTVRPESRSATFRLKLDLRVRLAAVGAVALPLAIWTTKPALLITFSLGLLAFLLRYVNGRALVGVDGIRIEWGPLERFVPYSQIESVQPLGDPPDGVALELKDPATGRPTGQSRRLYAAPPLHRRQISDGPRMARQIERTHRAFTQGASSGADLHARLARGGRPVAEWLRALRQEAARADYRSVALGREQLVAILESPDSPAESRVAAAAILRAQEDGPARVRVAARATAAPGIDAALEELADAESDEETTAALHRFVERVETKR
jgi:hypothetical protein